MVESAKDCIKERASSEEIYGKMQQVFLEMEKGETVSCFSPLKL
jgi:hypothetical protein